MQLTELQVLRNISVLTVLNEAKQQNTNRSQIKSLLLNRRGLDIFFLKGKTQEQTLNTMSMFSYFYLNELPLAYLRSLQNFCSVHVVIDISSWRNTKYTEVNAEREYFHNTIRKQLL